MTKHFSTDSNVATVRLDQAQTDRCGNTGYKIAKKFFDLMVSTLLLPVFMVGCIFLVLANPFFNRGPLFFTQKRMGKGCAPFTAIKFRTMSCAHKVVRGAHDPLEVERITRLGSFLRKARLDEIPQILNVLRGEMSLIGPRPDSYDHARVYVDLIPGYRERHAALPGISERPFHPVGRRRHSAHRLLRRELCLHRQHA